MQHRSLWRRLSLLLAIALLAAACGGADDTEDAGDTAEDTATEAPADAGTEAAEEPADAGTEAAVQNEGDGQLIIGTLLPETGSLAFLGPPEFAGVGLAVQEINEAGGVLGNDVQLIDGDSGDTSTDIANQTVDRLLGENVDVIVGAASSAVSLTVIDKITGAGVVQFSPANTSATFTTYDDRGLYFRTAPTDVLQGRVLGQLAIEDGAQSVAILALQDAYGEGLANFIEQSVIESGGEVLEKIIYDPQAQNFDAEVQQVLSADPDAIYAITFDEGSRLLTTMIEQGIGPQDKLIYGSDGNMGNALAEAVDAPLTGMKGTLPGAVAEGDFRERLLEYDSELIDFSYAGESYDAAIVSALAAIKAGTDVPTEFAQEIANVTRAPGTKCTVFEECKTLLEDGEEIDYDGQSGPIDLDDVGDPTSGTYQILQFNDANELELVETRPVNVEPEQE